MNEHPLGRLNIGLNSYNVSNSAQDTPKWVQPITAGGNKWSAFNQRAPIDSN